MRFSVSFQYDIPQPIKYANSDSSPLKSDESVSDEQSSEDDLSPSYHSKPLLLSSKSNHTSSDLSSNDNSLMTKNDNSTFKQIFKTP